MTFSKNSKLFGSFLIFILFSCAIHSNAQSTAQEINSAMGRGINLGNTLEPPLEGGWNNGPVLEYYFDDYKEAGFTCIRIPVRWDEHTSNSSPYTVSEEWMNRVEEVVDWGLSRGLYIVLNAHHEEWIKVNYDDQNMSDRFDSIWSQIAIRFQNKSEKLLFEMINEPNGISQANINKLNTSVLEVIRKTNPTRIVLFSGHRWSNSDELMSAAIPNDPYLIGYFHSYDPWSFAGEATGTWGTTADRNSLKSKFDKVQAWSEENNIPVTINEFGAIKNADYNSRMYHYASYVEEALNHNFSFNAWDDGGDFRIYQRNQRDWNEIKDILIYTSNTSPTKLSIRMAQDTLLQLKWTNRSETADSIFIERGKGSANFTKVAALSPEVSVYDDYNLNDGSTYFYRVVAHYSNSSDIPSYPIKGTYNPVFTNVDLMKDEITINSFRPGVVTIQTNNEQQRTISFYNLSGKLIAKKQVVNSFTEFQLNEKGILLYHLASDKGKIQTGKIQTGKIFIK
ncbi:MAG: cellulase family glycosylhydrolase [Prolixibacteraceae bacterium]|jgi:aryl-phospho-beta-D-glucosidase BglC (GH1 family)|nr:cellulase family glycosylhydrolase [Prolixibacteraceae bacterium]